MLEAEIKQRVALLESERKTQEGLWQEIATYITPYRAEFFMQNQTEGSIKVERPELFDGTALQAQLNLGANLHGNLTSPFFRWFHMKFREAALNDDSEAREWLESVAEQMWQALQESDFSLEIAEIYNDLTAFGTAALIEEFNEDDKLDFTAVPLKEVYFEEGAKGQPLNFYRILNWTALQIVDKFGDAVPDDIKTKAESAQASTERFRVFFCIFPRAGAKKGPAFKAMPPKRRPWGYKYILERDASLLGKEGGYYDMPAAVTRWNKINESRWGHGPSHIAVYDAKTLNRQEELMLQALAKVVDPPMVTTERGLVGDLDQTPGGLTVVKNREALWPLIEKIDYRVVDGERENRRNMIREYYFASRLDLKESPAMTATEVERRWQQMQKLLGPTLGRLQAELLDPIIRITFGALWRAGKLPPMPESLAGKDAALDIEYVGPIPLAQKQDQARAIETEATFAASMIEAYGPEATDPIDIGKAVREHAFNSGVPAKVLRSEADMKKKREARAAQEAEQANAAKNAAGATVVKDMSAGAKNLAEAGMNPNQLIPGGAPPDGQGNPAIPPAPVAQ